MVNDSRNLMRARNAVLRKNKDGERGMFLVCVLVSLTGEGKFRDSPKMFCTAKIFSPVPMTCSVFFSFQDVYLLAGFRM